MRVLLSAFLGFVVCAASFAQQSAPEPRDVRVVTAWKLSTLEKQLNDKAAEGYRVVTSGHGDALGWVSTFPFVPSGGISVLMQRTAGSGTAEYRVVEMKVRASSWEKKINELASDGFHLVPESALISYRQDPLIPHESPIVVMEKVPNESLHSEYSVVNRHGVKGFDEEVREKLSAGMRMLWMAPHAEWQMAILEKGTSLPDRQLLVSKDDEALIRDVQAMAAEGFQIVFTTTGLGGPFGKLSTAVYLERSESPVEYKFLPNREKSREVFLETARSGYRLLGNLSVGSMLTMMKSAHAYEYRFVGEGAAPNLKLPPGYTIVPSPWPILGKPLAVAERELAPNQ